MRNTSSKAWSVPITPRRFAPSSLPALSNVLPSLFAAHSLMLQFFMWGVYINGIAVYGRDGLLGCEEIEYRAKDLHCSYHDDDTPW